VASFRVYDKKTKYDISKYRFWVENEKKTH